jgi:Bifunctional DNA primase/polymerase, N-terminal
MTRRIRARIEAALELAAQGKPVFPVLDNKVPATPHSFKEASADSAAVRELWRKYPGPLVGVPTGEVTGFDVLDFDTAKHPEAAEWWRDNYRRLPRTRMHRTRSGGFHLLFKHDAIIRGTSSKIAPGVDTRGTGNFVVWWPAAGYPVLRDDLPLAPWPEWLLAELAPKPQPRSRSVVPVPDSRLLAKLVQMVAAAREGERNCLVFWCACRAGEMVAAARSAPQTPLR